MFTLLETLYGAYDIIAEKRGIYKVCITVVVRVCEYVMDDLLNLVSCLFSDRHNWRCVSASKFHVDPWLTPNYRYVAVCGLPTPRPDHAVAMTKFAIDVRSKTNEIIHELAAVLGEGTETLQMRIGLHSGSVTAGILRGQRARFDLFGDTVNTASRMESTGGANKIQVSQSTADLLMAAGKVTWLEKRETLVVAKGKGSMQTYWVEPPVPATG